MRRLAPTALAVIVPLIACGGPDPPEPAPLAVTEPAPPAPAPTPAPLRVEPSVGPSGELIGIDAASGLAAWRRADGHGGFLIVGTVGAGGGRRILLARDGITEWVAEAKEFRPLVRAIDLDTGAELWTSTALPGNDVWLLGATPSAVLLAGRCECGAERRPVCPTRAMALDRESGAVRWELDRAPTCDPPAFRWSRAGSRLFLATAGALAAVDVDSGTVAWSRPQPARVRAVAAQGNRVAVATAVALEALDAATGVPVWSRAGDFLEVGPAAAGWVATRALGRRAAERAIHDAADGAPRCRTRVVQPGPPPREIPEGPACAAVRATIRGRLLVDGEPRAGVRIAIGGAEIRTGADGRFALEVDAVGDYLVSPIAADLGRKPPRTCVFGEERIAHIAADGDALEVALQFEERRPLCASGGCAPIDCE
jgi:hypothetical protein